MVRVCGGNRPNLLAQSDFHRGSGNGDQDTNSLCLHKGESMIYRKYGFSAGRCLMKMLVAIICFLCTTFVSMPCYAVTGTSGNELLRMCTAVLDTLDNNGKLKGDVAQAALGEGLCLGLIRGIIDLNELYMGSRKDDVLFCTPVNGISTEQAIRIVVKYLKNHPEKLHDWLSTLLWRPIRVNSGECALAQYSNLPT
jgi:hypothetical protein